MTVLRSKDFWAGIMFFGFGLGFVIVARGYAMGSAARMGPSYFPTLLGGLLALLGLVIALHSLYRSREAIAGFGLRPLIMVLVSITLFAFTLERLGLLLSSALLVLVSSAAGPDFTIRRAIVLWVVLAGFSILVFHYGLRLPIRILPAA